MSFIEALDTINEKRRMDRLKMKFHSLNKEHDKQPIEQIK